MRRMPKLVLRTRATLLVCVVTSIVASCTDLLFDESRDDNLPKPLFAVGDATGPAPAPVSERSDVAIPWTLTGIGLSSGLPYRIAASGMLGFASNPTWYAGCATRPTIPPTVGPAGFDSPNRPHAVRVGIGSQTNPPSSTLAIAPLSASASEISSYAKGPGMLWVSRPTVIGWACGTPTEPSVPGWLVSGSQEVNAIELELPRLVPDKLLVTAGDTVRFDVQVSWTTNYWIWGGWRWVPDTNPSTSALVENCGRNPTCRAVVRERGHAEVTVIAEGMDLIARSPIIELASAVVRIRSVTGVLATRPAGTGGSSTLTLQVSVESNTGPLPNRTVELALDGIEQSGGHIHSGTMPAGGVSSTTVPTGATGVANVTYTADVFGGNVEVRGTSTGAASALETIVVRVPGLVQLFEAGNVDTIGPTTTHPSNHWGGADMISGLTALANAFYGYTNNTRKLQFNDISLQLGGKFDVAPTPIVYNPDGDHLEHRMGNSADVRYAGADPLTPAQQEYVRRWWQARYGQLGVLRHGDPNPHFHLRVKCTAFPCL